MTTVPEKINIIIIIIIIITIIIIIIIIIITIIIIIANIIRLYKRRLLRHVCNREKIKSL